MVQTTLKSLTLEEFLKLPETKPVSEYDVAVFVWSRIPCDERGQIANVFPLAPDWTIEILLPEQSQTC